MSIMSDDQIRYRILQILHKAAKDNPVSFGLEKEKMQGLLKISKDQIEFNMSYLEQKGLVRRSGFLGPPYWFATITAFGIDVVEHGEMFAKQFPFMQVTIQQIQGDIHGNVIQAVNSQINFSQQVNDAFKEAYDKVESKTGITPEQKAEVKKNLVALEEELKRERDLNKIQKLWLWLKENANWVAPTVMQVVLEGIKIALGN